MGQPPGADDGRLERENMTVYRIKIEGKEYSEDYTFTEPTEGSVKEEVTAILEEIKNGNIDRLEVKKEVIA